MQRRWFFSVLLLSLLFWPLVWSHPLQADPGLAAAKPVGACNVWVNKLNAKQPGAENGSRELVELWVERPAAAKTLAECGITHVAFQNGSGTGSCAGEHVVDLTHAKIPPSGYIIIGSLAHELPVDETTPTRGSWLQNGPDFLVLKNGEAVVGVLAYPDAAGAYPKCQVPGWSGPVVKVPPEPEGDSSRDPMLVLCGTEYRLAEYGNASWHAPNACSLSSPESGGTGGGAQPAESGTATDAVVEATRPAVVPDLNNVGGSGPQQAEAPSPSRTEPTSPAPVAPSASCQLSLVATSRGSLVLTGSVLLGLAARRRKRERRPIV